MTDSDTFWKEESSNARLAVEDKLLGVGTECYSDVKGELQILQTEPPPDELFAYDHVVEGSLDLPTGTLQVLACLDKVPSLELQVNPGTYRVRIYSSNLASVSDDNGDDFYILKIWPAKYRQPSVIKTWTY